MPDVILVDEHDREIGSMEKLAAHKAGRLHRCFSIFIIHPDGRMLLQKRASDKYHSGGLWTNTCCSHPMPGEDTQAAAKRRLLEEMGMECELMPIHTFTYRHEFDNGLIEHEYDHVFLGITDIDPVLNEEEAEDFAWVEREVLQEDIAKHPERYTYWFKLCLEDVFTNIDKRMS